LPYNQGYFIFNDKYLLFEHYLYQSGFHNLTTTCSVGDLKIRNFIHKDYSKEAKELTNSDGNFTARKLFERLCNDIIQLIHFGLKQRENERSVIARYILASFDLDICKCEFDGKKLFIRSWNKLINQYDYIKYNTYC